MSIKRCVAICATILIASTNLTNAQEPLEPAFYDSLTADLSSQIELEQTDVTPQYTSQADTGQVTLTAAMAGGKKKKPAGPNPLAASHKGLFFANDFSYLNDPRNPTALGDSLKLLPVAGGDWGTLDIGGQYRLRYHSEVGMGREGAASTPRFQDTNNDFLLSRLRLYTNWKINDLFRVYVEGIHAEATDDGGDYFPRTAGAVEQNRGDFLNFFIDVKLTDSLTARVGRQELLYGAQRLVSPLDWANTRQRFEGARLLYNNGNWASDTFWTVFVPVDLDELDEGNYNQRFYGNYTTYKGFENFTVDGYYLGFDNQNAGFSVHTLGMRLFGGVDNWLFEFEGAPQFGNQPGGQDHGAGFATIGLGRKLTKLPGGATIWFYYDYASGGADGGDFNQFNQLFPLGHKYLGFIDAVARTNVESPNILFTMKPGPKWNLLVWYYHFLTNDSGSSFGSLGNTPSLATGQVAGFDEIGDELDILLKYTICPRSNFVFGWSHFWRGNRLRFSADSDTDADFIYGQYTVNF